MLCFLIFVNTSESLHISYKETRPMGETQQCPTTHMFLEERSLGKGIIHLIGASVHHVSSRADRMCLCLNQFTENVRLSDQGNQALGTLRKSVSQARFSSKGKRFSSDTSRQVKGIYDACGNSLPIFATVDHPGLSN